MASAATKAPTRHATEQAQAALRALAGLPKSEDSGDLCVMPSHGRGEVTVTIPEEAVALLLEVLGQMANGNAVSVVPVQSELTTQQAADLLNVSRPFLIELLESGKIPFRMVGAHRRVRFTDLATFKEADNSKRRAILDELTSDAEKHGLGY